MVKNKKTNAYAEFINSRRPALEAKLGQKLSFDDVSQMVTKEWQSMGPEQRKKFKVNNTNSCPMDSYGVPLAFHEAKAREEQEVIEEMDEGVNKFIRSHVSAKCMRLLSFTTVSITEYLVKEEDGYEVFPAEVSLVKTSLGEGVDPNHFHSLVLPEQWPLGFEADVRKTAADVHNIPLCERDHEENVTRAKYCEPYSKPQNGSNCRQMLTVRDEVTDFLQKIKPSPHDPNTNYQVLYTLDGDLKKTRSVFYDRFNISHDKLKIWSLERLLKLLYDICGIGERFTLQKAKTVIKDPHQCLDFNLSIVCQWHQVYGSDQINHCSLSKARRYAHHLLKSLNLTDMFNVEVIEGRHWPKENNKRHLQKFYSQPEPLPREKYDTAPPVESEPTVTIGVRPRARVSAIKASLGVHPSDSEKSNAPAAAGQWRSVAVDLTSPFDASQFPSLPSAAKKNERKKNIMRNAQIFAGLIKKPNQNLDKNVNETNK